MARLPLITCLALALCAVTGMLFAGVLDHEFIPLDTRFYVTQSEWVQRGIDLQNLGLAFTTPVHGYWQPLTVLSHMLDCQLYGLDPRGHHLSSLLLHVVNVAVLFLIWVAATGRVWPSALVAALFGWHPTRVEAVAWVAQRRDLLSSLFGFLAIGAYLRFVRTRRPGAYALCALCMALSLMAKPMLVTLPVLLLLMDVWPLGRLAGADVRSAARRLGPLLLEKLPLLAMAVLISVVTIHFQAGVGAVSTLEQMPLDLRIWKSLLAYLEYLAVLVWPTGLSVLYPLDLGTLSPVRGLAAAFFLGLLTWAFARARRRAPQLLMGWLWFGVALLPVIGLIQAGSQTIADRFSYVPAIGLFAAVAFSLDAWACGAVRRRGAGVGALVVLVVLGGLTRSYVSRWRDAETLYRHSLASVGESHLLRRWLGDALLTAGRPEEAIVQLDRSIELKPAVDKYYLRAQAQQRRGAIRLALADYARGIALAQADHERIRGLLQAGALAGAAGLWRRSEHSYRSVLALDPASSPASLGLAEALVRSGRGAEALEVLDRASERRPDEVELLIQRAWIRAVHPDPALRDPDAALELATRACRQTDDRDPFALDALAAAQAARGEFGAALENVERAGALLASSPAASPAQRTLAVELERRRALYAEGRPFLEDLR